MIVIATTGCRLSGLGIAEGNTKFGAIGSDLNYRTAEESETQRGICKPTDYFNRRYESGVIGIIHTINF